MKLLYENALALPGDLKDFMLEGSAKLSVEGGCLLMENELSAAEGQKANYVLWCRHEFPDNIRIEWDFLPLREPGLAMLFFAAAGRGGESLFDSRLQPRNGEYPQYHHGDINAFHVSYFRRKEADERAFHTCNLRKSYGFHLVSQGADPLPDAAEAVANGVFYHICVEKRPSRVDFMINDLKLFRFEDDGQRFGPLLGGGCIGFRQLAPMKGAYRRLRVSALD